MALSGDVGRLHRPLRPAPGKAFPLCVRHGGANESTAFAESVQVIAPHLAALASKGLGLAPMTLLGLILIILGLILYTMWLAGPIRSASTYASRAETTNNCQTTVKKQTNKIAMS